MATTVRLLGPVEIFHDGREAALAGREPRVLLAALVLAGSDGVRSTVLADLLWGRDQPVAPFAGIRRHLDQVARAVDDAAVWDVERTDDGWRLAKCPPTDAAALAEVLAITDEDPGRDGLVRLHRLLAEAVACLLPEPLDGLRHPWFAAHRYRLERLQVDAALAFARAGRALGDPDDAVPLLERAVEQARYAGEPAVWEALALAHARAGRNAAAQDAVARGSRRLAADPALARTFEALRRRLSAVAFGLEVERRKEEARQAAARPAPRLLAPSPAQTRATSTSARPAAAQPLRFALFGSDRLSRDGSAPRPGTAPDRLLAALLVRRGTVVGLGELTGAVWGDDPPMRPHAAVEVNLQALRATVVPAPLPVDPLDGPAWRLTVPADLVDADVAAALATTGTDALAAGRSEEAATALRAALDRTDGEPLAGLDGTWFAAARERLVRWRASVVWSCVVAEVSCGRTDRALPDLRDLARANPLREDVWEWLVLATARHEGRAPALALYADLVRRLHRALGAEPGPALQAVRRRVETGAL
jgi:DNA-binding SARP family transcriptional activator